ncbi:MAG: nucleotidyl transferase AbiEii/AbiGii toxin family protein [Rhodanobacter sp.]|nr:MAG: nucleotidyl transferase AbiEii/AbiGii toxin family protein [Rhodanobacter sp.]
MSDPRADSVRARLLQRARQHGEDFNLLLTRYALERWLYRLSVSDERAGFVLKGALLFSLWFDEPHRPTRDADFLGFGAVDAELLRDRLQAICRIECDDGMHFDPDSVQVGPIREQARYDGLRAELLGWLGTARCNVQLDVGFGDAVTPAAQEMDYPTLLADVPAPHLRVYPRETVLAEKLEAMIVLGMRNSRMKDYFDVWVLLRQGGFDPAVLAHAIHATCTRRETALPEGWPTGLADEFATDAMKLAQWQAFLRKNQLAAPALAELIGELRAALEQPLDMARGLSA